MLNLMKTKGSQDENKNLKDVRGIQLSNTMKNMDIGELRPRQVCELVERPKGHNVIGTKWDSSKEQSKIGSTRLYIS